MRIDQRGAAPILLLVAAIGLLGFLVVTNITPFKDNLFSAFYPKPQSKAAGVSDPITPTPTPPQGPFSLAPSNLQTTLTCVVGDTNCYYQTTLIAINQTDKTLYNPTLYTSAPYNILSYVGFDGQWTTGKSSSTKIVQPGAEAINTLVKVVPPNIIGEWAATLYIDAQTCNNNVTPPDCIWYGASSFIVTVKVVSPTPTFTPTPTPVDTQFPTVSLTSPANGTTYKAGSVINMAAQASDDRGVREVNFFVDGKKICDDGASPYSCSWTMPSKKSLSGERKPSYIIQAQAVDTAGNNGYSQLVTIYSK